MRILFFNRAVAQNSALRETGLLMDSCLSYGKSDKQYLPSYFICWEMYRELCGQCSNDTNSYNFHLYEFIFLPHHHPSQPLFINPLSFVIIEAPIPTLFFLFLLSISLIDSNCLVNQIHLQM